MNKLKKILDGKEVSFTRAIGKTFTAAVKSRVLESAAEEINDEVVEEFSGS
ncbi:hypothetical protein [Chitinophaga sancti]|nr:hypothetical protein [Chitinophaga sancti]WQD65359.1 hypothetical protein U0033_13240 [Chitinophaga sancti]WQG89017.1 hypothetical protein SR876_29230 [Chitinophaga sancti]